MAAIDKSIYEEIVIESADGTKTVDIGEGVMQIRYFEDLFSPNITATIFVVNTGNTIEGKDGKLTTIYNGLPLRGGERVVMKIAGNSDNNKGLDFSKSSLYWHVKSVTGVMIDEQQESFMLNLVPREAITNETSRVGKKYPASSSISDSVKDIVKKYLKTQKEVICDKTQNPYGFIGNLRKPFTVLMWLASKGVPGTVSGGDATAGYFFFETQDGYNFKSIDQLIDDEPYETDYEYSSGVIANDPSNDFKILSFQASKNQDLMEKLKRGAYCSHRIYFNPLTFTYTNPEKGLFKLENYAGKTKNMGEKISLPALSENDDKTLGDVPSRNITAVMDIGTMEKVPKITKEDVQDKPKNADPTKIHSQSMMRYNLLMTHTATMLIPLNTNLRVGTLIKCRFPKIDMEKRTDVSEDQSGLYMIKELCHQFDSSGSYTKLTLFRDTLGPKGK
tara:strand:+ start:447 stop:1787 length:1341 start_codon:yes stop_codon:yes gene_type:complete